MNMILKILFHQIEQVRKLICIIINFNFLKFYFIDYLDFDNTRQQVRFTDVRQHTVEVTIPIVDDDIDEADEQVFIVFLEVVTATNLNKVNINRQTSIGRIKDDESKWFAFIINSHEGCML